MYLRNISKIINDAVHYFPKLISFYDCKSEDEIIYDFEEQSMLLDYIMSFIKKVNNMKTLNCGNYLDNEIKMQIKLLFEPRICNAMIL